MRSPIRRTRSFYARGRRAAECDQQFPPPLVTIMRPSRARCVTEGYHATSVTSVLSSCLF
jgi:hypothetical protein